MNKNIIKDYSRKISERMWNLPEKGELESHREETYIDDIIQKNQFILDEHSDDPFVQWCISNRQNAIDTFYFKKSNIKKLMTDGLMG